MKRNILNSPRLLELKKHRRKIFLGKIMLFVFSVVVIFFVLVYVSRISTLNISSIEILNNKSVDAEMVKTVVQKKLSENVLYFFPKTNIFYYPENVIKNELLQEFTRIRDVNFSIKDRKTLEVSITERTALYTWCGNTVPEIEDSNQKCYFMDDLGYVFDEAPYFSGEVYFKFYGLLVGGTTLGSNFSSDIFSSLILFKKKLEDMKLKPVALYVQEDKDIKIFLSSKTSSMGPEIIFKSDSDLINIGKNLEAALNTEPLLSNFKNKYASLLYIDLRFGNKVYYKFK